MFRFACALIAVLVVGQVRHSCGYKWVALKENDPIPEHAVYCGNTIVGRARHFNVQLPAEVYNSTYAVVNACSKQWVKTKFEILVVPEECEWRTFDEFKDVPENIVLVGSMEDNEPIYVAKTNRENNPHLVRLYMSNKGITNTFRSFHLREIHILICEDLNVWVDTSASQIPNNTIVALSSEEIDNVYVGRVLKNCDIFPGEVIPAMKMARAVTPDGNVKSRFCQVLVGEPDEYRWVTASNGEIPDYAVAGAHNEGALLMYVAIVDGNLGYITYTTAYSQSNYKVLVRNVDY